MRAASCATTDLDLRGLAAMSLQAAEHSFLPAPARQQAQAKLQAWQIVLDELS